MSEENKITSCENTDSPCDAFVPADAEPTSERVIPEVISDSNKAKSSVKAKKRPKAPKKWGVGAFFALIPTVICLIIITVSAVMNKLSFYDMPVFKRNVMLISVALVIISALLAAFRPRIPKALGWIIWAAIPAGTMMLTEWVYRNPFDDRFPFNVFMINLVVY